MGIARHKVEEHYRARLRAPGTIEDLDRDSDVLALFPEFEKLLEQEQVRKNTWRVMACLREEYRLALIWRYSEKASAREMASKTGKTDRRMFKVLGQHTCMADPANIERFDALARTCNPDQFLKNAERAASGFDFGESHEWASLSLTEHQRRVDLRFQARGCSLRLFRLNSLGNPFHQFVIREVASHGSTSLGIQRGRATADARSPSLSFRSSLPYRAPTLFPSNARPAPAGIVREGRTLLAKCFCELVP